LKLFNVSGSGLKNFGRLSRRHVSLGGREWPAVIVGLDVLFDGTVWRRQIGVDMEQ
jgi:hypothetical protein